MDYDEQLSAAKFRAERDLARQECERLRARLRDSVPREAYERKRAAWLRQIRECETALHRRRECIKRLENAALERRAVREEDREAAEWVRGQGGIEVLRRMFQDADSRRVELCGALGINLDKGWSEAMAAMRLRLMPEGMEWPRFEDGEPVRVGDEFMGKDGKTYTVQQVQFIGKCFSLYDFCDRKAQFNAFYGERVKRPAPKVLDADGVEIRVGDRLYDTETGCARIVRAINASGTVEFEGCEDRGWFTRFLTHRAPVLDADGRPLREGETVWDTNGDELVIGALEDGGHTVACRYVDVGDAIPVHGMWSPSDLTHERPVLDADGVPINVGDTVWNVNTGDELVVDGFDGRFIETHHPDGEPVTIISRRYLTHTKPEPPDSWERWREEWRWPPVKYCKLILGVEYDHDTQLQESFDAQGDDLVRRARALAERGM